MNESHDIRQRVWTYLSQSDVPRSCDDVAAAVNCTIASAMDALYWWYDQGELWKWERRCPGIREYFNHYTIKDRV